MDLSHLKITSFFHSINISEHPLGVRNLIIRIQANFKRYNSEMQHRYIHFEKISSVHIRMQLKTTANTGTDTGNIPTNEGPSASCHNATIHHLFCLSIAPGYPNLEPESQILFSPKNQGKSSYFPLHPPEKQHV